MSAHHLFSLFYFDKIRLLYGTQAMHGALLAELLPNFEIPIFSRVQRPLLWLSHNPRICSQFLSVYISEITSALAWNWRSGWVVGFDKDFPIFSCVWMLLIVWRFWNQVPPFRTDIIVVATTEESGLTVNSGFLRIHMELTEKNKRGMSFWRGGIFFVSNNRSQDIQCFPGSYYCLES